jgi:hypothetical protein
MNFMDSTIQSTAMKFFRGLAALTLLATFALIVMSMAMPKSPSENLSMAGKVEVTLQNKCSREVNYKLSTAGVVEQGTISKSDKVKVSVSVGTEIRVDGEEFMTVAASDQGQTFQVCR